MKKSLVVFFSKAGEQYAVGTITKGNTAILAEMIADLTGAATFEVRVRHDTYPTTYTALTQAAKAEKAAKARPEPAADFAAFDAYDTVFLGTPNWWADMPMPLYTFIESHRWAGKTLIPFVTHEGSGLSSIPKKIQAATGATVLDGLAVYGHIAQRDSSQARAAVAAWLHRLGF